jgi:hypothetical protein
MVIEQKLSSRKQTHLQIVRVFIPNAREVLERKRLFSRQESIQCQTTETTNLIKSEVRVIISKHLNTKKFHRFNNRSNLEGTT